jgi:hypothetical protein
MRRPAQCVSVILSRYIYAQTTESGKDWECFLNIIAIIFRCLYQLYWGSDSPLSIVPSGIEPAVVCRTIPHEFQTFPRVMESIAEILGSQCPPCLLVLVPSYSRFPDVDGFVVYCGMKTVPLAPVIYYGYEVKTGRAYPKYDAPIEMTNGLLLRGKSPAMSSLRRGWDYTSREGVRYLLGCSLEPMYPDSWPDYPSPNNDGFD